MTKTSRQLDLVWVLLTGWFMLLERRKCFLFFRRRSKNCWQIMTGGTSTQQLWLYPKLDNTSMMLKRSLQYFRWLWPSSGMRTQWWGTLLAMLLDRFLMICSLGSRKNTELIYFLSSSCFLRRIQSPELFLIQLLPWQTSLKEWNLSKFKVNSKCSSSYFSIIPTTEFPSCRKVLFLLFLQPLKLLNKNSNLTLRRLSRLSSFSTLKKNTNKNNTSSLRVNLLKLSLSLLLQSVLKCLNLQLRLLLILWFSSKVLNSSKQILKKLTLWQDGKDSVWFMVNNLEAILTKFCLVFLLWWKKLSKTKLRMWMEL